MALTFIDWLVMHIDQKGILMLGWGIKWTPELVKVLIAINKDNSVECIDYTRNITQDS